MELSVVVVSGAAHASTPIFGSSSFANSALGAGSLSLSSGFGSGFYTPRATPTAASQVSLFIRISIIGFTPGYSFVCSFVVLFVSCVCVCDLFLLNPEIYT